MASSPTQLSFRANQFFFLPFGMKLWAALYDLTQGEFRLQVRNSELDPTIVYTFDNLAAVPYPNSPPSAGQGTITYDPVSQIMEIRATYADVKTFLSTANAYVYDLQYSIRDVTGAVVFVRDLAYGTLTVSNGVTRS